MAETKEQWTDRIIKVFGEGAKEYGTEFAVGTVQSVIHAWYWSEWNQGAEVKKQIDESKIPEPVIPNSDLPPLPPLPPYQPKKSWFQKLLDKERRR